MKWSIEYRGAEGAAASEVCRNEAPDPAAVAHLLRQQLARGYVLDSEHGPVVARDRVGAGVVVCWFVE